MGNLIINFDLPNPVPANGLKVYYKKSSDISYVLLTPNVYSSPATVPVEDDTVEYNGYILCDCGGGVDSTQINFIAEPCKSPENKMINGKCVAGIKVYTSSVDSGSPTGTSYTCTFVYVYPADASQSDPQTEINPSPCRLGVST